MSYRIDSGWASFALAVALGIAPIQANALSAQIGLNFTSSDSIESGFIPPDSMGAVGPNQIVELINGRYTVYRTSDGVELDTSSLDQFWIDAGAPPVDDSFDPRVMYDPGSGRWFAAAVDNARDPNSFLLAVSDTSDPGDGWTAFSIDADSTDERWADFPMLGLNADGVFLSANMFPITGSSSTVTKITVIALPKADLLGLVPTVANAVAFENLSVMDLQFTPQLAFDPQGSGSAPILAVGGNIAGVVQLARINDTDTTGPFSPTLDLPFVSLVGSEILSTPASQPGPSQDLDSGDNRFSSALVVQGDSLWGVQSVDVDGRNAVRWFEFDPDQDPFNIVLQSGLITDPELDLYYPSIAVNEFEEIVIGLSGSSESQFVSAYAIVGETLAGTTTFGDLLLLKAGAASYELLDSSNRNRWGDYSATVVDPDDPRTFWTFQEFVLSEDVWGTQITQIFLPEPALGLLLTTGLLALGLVRRGRLA